MSVLPSYWKIAAIDAASVGIVVVTLKSGVVIEGRLNRELSQSDNDALHLRRLSSLFQHIDGRDDEGFHTIDYDDIAAISGRPVR